MAGELFSKTIREIHSAIKESSRYEYFAEDQGVSPQILHSYLAAVTYTNDQEKIDCLKYSVLKKWSVEEAVKYLGTAYDNIPDTTKNPLNEKTLEEIHKVVKKTVSSQAAEAALKTTFDTLSRSLHRFTYPDKNNQLQTLTYKALANITVEDAKKIWPNEYSKPISEIKIVLDSETLSTVHSSIIACTTEHEVAAKYGLTTAQFRSYLGGHTFTDIHQNKYAITYNLLKKEWNTKEKAKEALGAIYEKSAFCKPKKIVLRERTVRAIHWAILQSDSVTDAGAILNVDGSTLGTYLNKFTYQSNGVSRPYTYELFKELYPTIEKGEETWGDAYDKAMAVPKIPIDSKNLDELHELIIKSNTPKGAALKLSTPLKTFKEYLGTITYIDNNGNRKNLNYLSFKNMSAQQARSIWGVFYKLPPGTKDFGLDSPYLQLIKDNVAESLSLADAANKIGITEKNLDEFLSKFNYHNGQQLNYAKFKELLISIPQQSEDAPVFIQEVSKATVVTEAIPITETKNNLLGTPDTYESDTDLSIFTNNEPDENTFTSEDLESPASTDVTSDTNITSETENSPEETRLPLEFDLELKLDDVTENTEVETSILQPPASPDFSELLSFSFFNGNKSLKRKGYEPVHRLFLSEIAYTILFLAQSEEDAAQLLETTSELLNNALAALHLTYDDIKNQTEIYTKISNPEQLTVEIPIPSQSNKIQRRN